MPNDRILVVDDEETIREIVSSMLGGAHFQTRQAASGLEALKILESGEEFDLVLSDLMMAEMDGIALLERAKERYPDMPIVMVTAVHDIQVALQALRNGAYDYLLKPFELDALGRLIRDGAVVQEAGLEPVDRPRFYELRTADGIPYERLARLHGHNPDRPRNLAKTVTVE